MDGNGGGGREVGKDLDRRIGWGVDVLLEEGRGGVVMRECGRVMGETVDRGGG